MVRHNSSSGAPLTDTSLRPWYAGSWNGPVEFPQFGTLSSTPSAAVTKDGSTQLVFWQGPGGHLFEAWYAGSWNGPVDWTAAWGGRGLLASAPSVVTTARGEQLVFWRGTDGHLWEAWYTGVWNGPADFAKLGTLASAPSAAVTPDGTQQLVFWQGVDNRLTEVWYAGSWNGPVEWTGLGSLSSPPSVAVTPDGSTQIVFYRSRGGHLLESWYARSWNGPVDWTNGAFGGKGSLTSSPSATVLPNGSQQLVFWQGSGSTLWEAWYAGGSWNGPVDWSRPTPTPTPTPTGWPGPSNTGVPAGTVLTPSGSITVTTPGTVLNALDVTGFVDIEANNVTLKNSRVRGGQYAYVQVRIGSAFTGALIEDTEIDGQHLETASSPDDGYGIAYGGFTALRDNIHGNVVGVTFGDPAAVLQDSWVHDLNQTANSHIEDILSNGTTAGITIRHNRLDNQIDQTATVALFGDFGPIQNATVDDNLLNGGGWSVYAGHNLDKTYGTQDANNKFTNNHFMRTPDPSAFWPSCGYFGPVTAFDSASPGDVWTGNVWDDTGAAVPPGG